MFNVRFKLCLFACQSAEYDFHTEKFTAKTTVDAQSKQSVISQLDD